MTSSPDPCHQSIVPSTHFHDAPTVPHSSSSTPSTSIISRGCHVPLHPLWTSLDISRTCNLTFMPTPPISDIICALPVALVVTIAVAVVSLVAAAAAIVSGRTVCCRRRCHCWSCRLPGRCRHRLRSPSPLLQLSSPSSLSQPPSFPDALAVAVAVAIAVSTSFP